MKRNMEFIVGVGGLLIGLVGVGYAIGSQRKIDDICEKIDKSVDEVSKNVRVDISDNIIDQSVNKAVDREVRREVEDASRTAVKRVKEDMNKEIRSAVKDEYNNIKETVTDKIAKEVSNINMRDLSDDIVEKAKKEVLKKFDGKLDDIADDFKQQLNNTSKIYKSIANSFTRESDRTMTFRL